MTHCSPLEAHGESEDAFRRAPKRRCHQGKTNNGALLNSPQRLTACLKHL